MLSTEKLERQLVLEREKHQRVESENQRLLQRIYVVSLDGATVYLPATIDAEIELVKGNPLEINAVETSEPEVDEYAFDWCTLPNTELNSDRSNDAYKEKLRRSVAHGSLKLIGVSEMLRKQWVFNPLTNGQSHELLLAIWAFKQSRGKSK